ncbi:hypothetical protein HBH69_169130 [Parastagonospora nodorum]|nr:hypothetical protein HBH46_093620 [Parastagonospora nodorum]KAH4916465.1 hypothetical protein HBH74_141220 [Parastagonospora nodorum]KAH4927549.1 hypothetical protein HBH73_202080 [Parastagonospora nodorum]KAH5147528.1 hypothetical protein HBH69_169130 [Parastagonospora nodorum]KAH5248660.1 hypothetical protein HBI72_163690 [Parastagonospora nodorum]
MASWKIFPEPSGDVDVEYTPFLQSRKFFAVDDSGSTAGTVLRRERAFVDQFRTIYANRDDTISLWGSRCDSPTHSFEAISWRSQHGGTTPSQIFHDQGALNAIKRSDVWFLLTDGEIWEQDVHQLAKIAQDRDVLNIPLVFLITGSPGKSPGTANISVGISFFASSEDTLILFKEISTGRIYVIAGKGCFAALGGSAAAQNLESWDDLQLFGDETSFFKECKKLEVQVIKAEFRPESAKGIALGTDWEERQHGPVRVDLDLLPKAGVLSKDDLCDLLADNTFDALSVAYKTRSRIAELRGFLQKQKIEQVAPKLEDVAGAGALITKMGDVKTTAQERVKLQERLRAAHAKNRDHYQKSTTDFIGSEQEIALKKRNQLVDGALRTLAAIEAAGFNAEILSRKSNRARRADVIETATTVDMMKLDLDAPAYKGFCQICCDEEVIMSICFKEMEADKVEDNTTDFALNFPLAAGASAKNVGLISSQNICFQCAVLSPSSRSIYHEPLTAVIPALKYDGSNKKYINEQLYLALTAKLATGAAGIAQLFMSILLELINTRAWAGSDMNEVQLSDNAYKEIRQRRETFEWMLNQLLKNTFTREDFKETGDWVRYPQALEWVAKDFETNGLASFAVTYPALGFNVLLELSSRVGKLTVEQAQRMRAAKVIHSIASKYLVDLQIALQNKLPDTQWKQKYLEVIYKDFNGTLTPKDQNKASLVTDSETFKQHLSGCIQEVDVEINDNTMRKIQLILYWLLFTQKGHCTAQTFFTRMRDAEPLATTVLSVQSPLPALAHYDTLLSIFASHNAHLINAKLTACHVSAVVPFANPFGASVLHCGACDFKFTNVTKANQMSEKNVQKLRHERAKHLIAVFGLASRFEKSTTGLPERTSPPTSLHFNLHMSIVREWEGLSTELRKEVVTDERAKEDFVGAVRKRLCSEGRGNIHQDDLDKDTRALLPSFFRILKRALEGEGKKEMEVWDFEFDRDKGGVGEKARWELEMGMADGVKVGDGEALEEWEFA